ncbi:MAG: 23S rRNA (adenine(2503)-C(2))-methyltransferase RlmN [Planctomycetota bacterium]
MTIGAAKPVPNPLAMTHDRFAAACLELGIKRPGAMKLYHDALRHGKLPQPHASLPVTGAHSEDTPEGVTTKFLTRVDRPSKGPIAGDGRVEHLEVESVIIPMIGRRGARTSTLCVSSQVGCGMGCGFCETAQMGLIRSLTVDEIVAQWFNARFGTPFTEPTVINNIVFMGMGEPMDNPAAVIDAIAILTDHHGPAIPMSKITVSTVGRVDGIRKLARAMQQPGWHRLGLAISVNAPNDDVRNEIMPINRTMPMADLRDALLQVPLGPGKKLCFEYVLIPGVNDRTEHAHELADYLSPWLSSSDTPVPRGLVNVIPYNPRRNSPWPAPNEEDVERFIADLIDRGVFVKRRRTKGRSQMAACGQLGAAHIRKRRYVGLTTP